MRLFKPDLQKMLERQDARALIQVLTDRDWQLRHKATDALVKIGGPAVEPLLKALDSALRSRDQRDVERVSWIIDVLGRIRDERAVEPLIGVLKNADRELTPFAARAAAARALGRLGDQRAVEPLMVALKKGWDKDVRRAVLYALEDLGAPVQKEREIEERKFREGHAYLVLLWSQTPPTGLESEQIAIGMGQQLGMPTNVLESVHVDSMPTHADAFVVSAALLACEEWRIPFDSERDEIAFRSGMGLGIVTIKIKPSTA